MPSLIQTWVSSKFLILPPRSLSKLQLSMSGPTFEKYTQLKKDETLGTDYFNTSLEKYLPKAAGKIKLKKKVENV